MAKQSDKKVTKARLPVLSKEEDKPVVQEQKKVLNAGLGNLAGLQNVDVRITLEWGRTEITVEEALKLAQESLLKVDQFADEPIDVRVNGKLFGRGTLVVVGESYGVQLTEIIE